MRNKKTGVHFLRHGVNPSCFFPIILFNRKRFSFISEHLYVEF
nr:MAG TPA: protein of unknown function (DUF4222) [Caudoviricetes sp.]